MTEQPQPSGTLREALAALYRAAWRVHAGEPWADLHEMDLDEMEQAIINAGLVLRSPRLAAAPAEGLVAILHRFHHLTPCPYPMGTGYHSNIAGKKPCEIDAAEYARLREGGGG